MLLFVSAFFHFAYVFDPPQGLMCLLIPSMYVFTCFQPHESVFLKSVYASGEEITFSCELHICFSELTVQE
jgi:hypothetical protein